MRAEPICEMLGRMRSGGAALDDILREAVRGLHDAHGAFHWTGIYELYPDGVLRLGPYVGAPTDHVFIAVGRGVCGTAVAEGRNQNIPDVTKAGNYLACSADTRSELVVLIRRGDRIYAQIDIDSHDVAAFGEPLAHEVEKLADWLADCYEERERS